MSAGIDLETAPHAVPPATVAQILGVGVRQARDWIAKGEIYSFRVGRRILVPKAALKRLLEREPEREVTD